MYTPFLLIRSQKTPRTSQKATLLIEESPDEWTISCAGKLLQATIKKRRAYPTTYCQQIDPSTVLMGYGSEAQDEFLTVTLQGNAVISIVRDSFAILPLFYYEDAFFFVLSNEYEAILKHIEAPTVCESSAIDHLMMVDHPIMPPIEGVSVLKEQEKLEFHMGSGIMLSLPPDRPWRYSTDAPRSDPKTFFSVFSEYLDYFIESRFSGQRIAFGVSGGLDSATLPQYFYCKTNQPICMASMLLGPPYDVSQRSKLQAIAKQTNATHIAHTLDATTMAPLSSITEPRYAEATYLEAMLPLVCQLREIGVEVFATGDSGDEFFHNVTDESFGMSYGRKAHEARQSMELPEFFTPAFRRLTWQMCRAHRFYLFLIAL